MRLSLIDLARIVLACAVASFALTPLHGLLQLDGVMPRNIFILEAIVFPLVLALSAFVLVRPGPRRIALVECLILCAALVPVGCTLWAVGEWVLSRSWASGPRPTWPVDLAVLAIAAGLAALVSWLAVRLARRARGIFARRAPSG